VKSKGHHLELTAKSDFAVVVRACATAIGLAGFAILASYSIDEVMNRLTGASPRYVQALLFQCAQLGLALFLLWPDRAALFPDRKLSTSNIMWAVTSIALGLALAIALNSDAASYFWNFLTSNAIVEAREKLNLDDLAFGSLIAHSLIWLTHTALLVPLAENLVYRELVFKLAEPKSRWLIAAASLVTYSLAYFFNGGFDGMLFALQIGAVLTVLRVISGSVLFPILAHMVFGAITQSAALVAAMP
jgi:membrane protease YdiL (CAAX protease family)